MTAVAASSEEDVDFEGWDADKFCSRRCAVARAQRLDSVQKIVQDAALQAIKGASASSIEPVVKPKQNKAMAVGLGAMLAACEKKVVEMTDSEENDGSETIRSNDEDMVSVDDPLPPRVSAFGVTAKGGGEKLLARADQERLGRRRLCEFLAPFSAGLLYYLLIESQAQ